MEIQKQSSEQFKIEKPDFSSSKQKSYIERILITRGIPNDTRKSVGQWYNKQLKNIDSSESDDMHYIVTCGDEIYSFVQIDSMEGKTATFSVLTTIDGCSKGYELPGYLAALNILGRNHRIEKVVTKIDEKDEHTIKTLKFLGFEDNGTGSFSLDREPVYQSRGAYKKERKN